MPRTMDSRSLLKKAGLMPLAAVAIVAAQLVHARRRPDLPSLTNQDPSIFYKGTIPTIRRALAG